jgi:hypothetical protein
MPSPKVLAMGICFDYNKLRIMKEPVELFTG